MNPSSAVSNTQVQSSYQKVTGTNWTLVLDANPRRIAAYFCMSGAGLWILQPASGLPSFGGLGGAGVPQLSQRFVWPIDGPICSGQFWLLCDTPPVSLGITELWLNRECDPQQSTLPVSNTPLVPGMQSFQSTLQELQQLQASLGQIPIQE